MLNFHHLSVTIAIFITICPSPIWMAPAPTSLSLTVSPTPPASAAGPVDHSFIGFAFEAPHFYVFSGNKGAPNAVSQNLFHEVTSRVGNAPLYLRIGGTSWDFAPFNPSQTEPINWNGAQGHKMPFGITIGPSYFDTLGNFPEAKYIISVPVARNKPDESTALARAAYQRVGAKNIALLEIGNEPDLYVNQNQRPKGWGLQQHVAEWKQYVQKIQTAVQGSAGDNGGPKFEALALSSPPHPGDYWDPKDLFADGLDQDKPLIGTLSEHYYQTVFNANSDYPRDIMSHASTTKALSYFGPKIDYLRQSHPNIPLVLAEVGQALPGKKGAFDISQETSLGGGLWGIDFMCKAMAIGIKFVTHQQLPGSPFAAFQPADWTETPPAPASTGTPANVQNQRRANQPTGNSGPTKYSAAVYPLYHGILAIADFIGPNSQAELRVAEIPAPNNDPDLAIYGAFEAKSLKRLVLLNLKAWSAELNKGTQRGTKEIRVQVSGTKKASLRRLTGQGGWTGGKGFQEGKVTYGELTWTAKSQGKGVKPDGSPGHQVDEPLQVDDQGCFTVKLADSEAAVVFLG